MKKQSLTKRISAFLLALLLVVTMTPGTLTVEAAKKPSIKKTVSTTISGTKTLKITKAGYTIKSVKVKTSKATVAKATATKSKLTVYGIKAGKATITATVKAKKGKTTKSFTLKSNVTVKAPTGKLSAAALKVGETAAASVSGIPSKASVVYASTDDAVAAVAADGTVTAAKAGSADITAKITFPKTKFAKKTVKTVVCGTVTVTAKEEADTDTEKTVATLEELKAALANQKITKITIGEKATTLEIPAGIYRTVDLVVNAPKATIVNKGVFKTITIKAVAPHTYTEDAKGNSITVENAEAINLEVAASAEVAELNFAGTATVNSTVTVSGTVTAMNVTSKAPVSVTAKDNAKVDTVVVKEASDFNLSAADKAQVGTLTVDAPGADVDLTLAGTAKVENVNVTEKAATATATGQTKVDIIAAGSGTVGTVATTATNASVKVVANDNASVETLKVTGDASASISGTSDKVTTVDIKEAGEKANVTVNTDTVKIVTDTNTDANKVIDNETGKTITTEVHNTDGTTTTTETSADGNNAGTGSTGSTGSEQSSPALTAKDVWVTDYASTKKKLHVNLGKELEGDIEFKVDEEVATPSAFSGGYDLTLNNKTLDANKNHTLTITGKKIATISLTFSYDPTPKWTNTAEFKDETVGVSDVESKYSKWTTSKPTADKYISGTADVTVVIYLTTDGTTKGEKVTDKEQLTEGKKAIIEYTAADGDFTTTFKRVITVVADKKVTTATITGTAKVGETLTATTDGIGSITYQWYIKGTSENVAIPSATSATFVVRAEDVGKQILVEISGTGDKSKESDPTSAVAKGVLSIKAGSDTENAISVEKGTKLGKLTGSLTSTIIVADQAGNIVEGGSWAWTGSGVSDETEVTAAKSYVLTYTPANSEAYICDIKKNVAITVSQSAPKGTFSATASTLTAGTVELLYTKDQSETKVSFQYAFNTSESAAGLAASAWKDFPDGNKAQVTGLTGGTKYYFFVRTKADTGVSASLPKTTEAKPKKAFTALSISSAAINNGVLTINFATAPVEGSYSSIKAQIKDGENIVGEQLTLKQDSQDAKKFTATVGESLAKTSYTVVLTIETTADYVITTENATLTKTGVEVTKSKDDPTVTFTRNATADPKYTKSALTWDAIKALFTFTKPNDSGDETWKVKKGSAESAGEYSADATAVIGVGTYTVQVTIAGNDLYNEKVVTAAFEIEKADNVISAIKSGSNVLENNGTISINAQDETLTADEIATALAGEQKINATATSGETVSISWSSEDAENLTEGVPNKAGNYTLTISAAGNDNYDAATDVVYTITIQKAEP